jgi:hypothetical protein
MCLDQKHIRVFSANCKFCPVHLKWIQFYNVLRSIKIQNLLKFSPNTVQECHRWWKRVLESRITPSVSVAESPLYQNRRNPLYGIHCEEKYPTRNRFCPDTQHNSLGYQQLLAFPLDNKKPASFCGCGLTGLYRTSSNYNLAGSRDSNYINILLISYSYICF